MYIYYTVRQLQDLQISSRETKEDLVKNTEEITLVVNNTLYTVV